VQGAGAYFSCANFELTNVSFVRNHASSVGGGLVIDDCTGHEINLRSCTNCSFHHNVADENGGGILLRTESLSSGIDVRSTRADQCVSLLSTINQPPSMMLLDNTSGLAEQAANAPVMGYNNNSGGNGGYSFNNAVFVNNSALQSGGAICYTVVEWSSLTFGPTVNITANKAGEFGGGIYFGSRLANQTWLVGAWFEHNWARFGGGSVAWGLKQEPDDTAFCAQCSYISNSSPYQLVNGFATGNITSEREKETHTHTHRQRERERD
jgi:predicted outer membrane repeat protein